MRVGENKRRNMEEMKKLFLGREKKSIMRKCVTEKQKFSEVISKPCQRRQ